jgi:hypothetical protein
MGPVFALGIASAALRAEGMLSLSAYRALKPTGLSDELLEQDHGNRCLQQ